MSYKTILRLITTYLSALYRATETTCAPLGTERARDGPLRQFGDDGQQGVALGRHGVFHARRYVGIGAAAYQSVGLELLERGAEHLGRDVWQGARHLAEPQAAALAEHGEQQQAPLGTETRNDVADGAAGCVGIFF